MRELHGWHGDRGRHAHDAHAPVDQYATRAHDAPKHAAQDALKLKMLLDPEARKAARRKYQQQVEAAEADYAARHAKPKPGDQGRAAEEPRPQESRPEPVPPETRDKPASKLAAKWDAPESQREERRQPERSRLPRAETVQMLAGNGLAVVSVAAAFNVLPDSWEKVAASVAAAVVANVAWGNRRWKDKHGNRPED